MQRHPWARRAAHILAVFAAAALLCWPALYNRYPLIFPDSAAYLQDGGPVLRALTTASHPSIGWRRSPLYSLSILPFHRNRTPWPIVPLHAVALSYILSLVVRSVVKSRPLLKFLTLTALLSVLTGVAWVCSWILADILGAIAYLGLFLLVFAAADLSRAERLLVSLLVCWGTVAHLTHLILMSLLCALLLAVAVLRRAELRVPIRPALTGMCVLAIALALQLTVNARLYGHFDFTGDPHPPFLMARLISDGPGYRVLSKRCGRTMDWHVCRFLPVLSTNIDDFLWEADGPLANSSPAQVADMDQQQTPLLLATLHEYPVQQLRRSAENFFQQLITFDLDDFGDSPATDLGMEGVIPGAGAAYRHSRQFTSSMPTDLFTRIQNWTVAIACVIILATLIRLRSRLGPRLLALTAIIAIVVVANAAVTGVISDVDSRYQVRVIWLVPLLAGLYLFRRSDLLEETPQSHPGGEVAV